MKYLNIFLMLAAFTAFCSCASDDLNSDSIFDTTEVQRNEFDKWLKTNYTDPYNIEFNYMYNDKLSDNYYNVAPAKLDKSIAMAKLIKHVWMDAYKELAGPEFLKNKCFRQFQLIGSAEYDSQNSIVLGTAEGGLKVLLYRINELDMNNIFVNHDDPYRQHEALPLDLNYWYFHTMHHEFCHILTQTKNYSTEFRTISTANYHASDWVNVEDEDAATEGFVTGYASKEYNEDFAEVYATYVTNTEEAWEKILAHGVDTLSYDVKMVDYVNEQGETEYEIGEDGGLIPETDEEGNIIYQKDENGNYVYYLNDGKPIQCWQRQIDHLYYISPYKLAWEYQGSYYYVTSRLPSDKPVYQTNQEGEIVYDKDGNPVPEYYKIPKFKLKQVEKKVNVKTDDKGKQTILQKLAIVRAYFQDSWGINLDELRKIVLRRSEEAPTLDLKTLN